MTDYYDFTVFYVYNLEIPQSVTKANNKHVRTEDDDLVNETSSCDKYRVSFGVSCTWLLKFSQFLFISNELTRYLLKQ